MNRLLYIGSILHIFHENKLVSLSSSPSCEGCVIYPNYVKRPCNSNFCFKEIKKYFNLSSYESNLLDSYSDKIFAPTPVVAKYRISLLLLSKIRNFNI